MAFPEKNCNTCGQKCAIKYHGCSNWIPMQSGWIPVSERLPDVAQRVLLSGHGTVMVGMLHSFGKYSLEPTGISHVYPKDDIVAWMPLPEPYREDGGE